MTFKKCHVKNRESWNQGRLVVSCISSSSSRHVAVLTSLMILLSGFLCNWSKYLFGTSSGPKLLLREEDSLFVDEVSCLILMCCSPMVPMCACLFARGIQ